MPPSSARAGRYIRQPTGYRAFIPAPLPPDPPLALHDDLVRRLSRADQALGRLDGIARTLPAPEVFIEMFMRREAVLSSRIEGTRSTLDDMLASELGQVSHLPEDVREVNNYLDAMHYGIERLATLPLSVRLIRELHERLMRGVRGQERTPGELRRSQNWIGPPGATLDTATYVPPPVHEMHEALGAFERFLHEEVSLPVLIHTGLAHAQFEVIHPFLDGNGRTGRLLVTLLLVHRGVLVQPILYLSDYFERFRAEYYERLSAVHQDGDWEAWLSFFLNGVAATAASAAGAAAGVAQLREHHRALLTERAAGPGAVRLLDLLYQRPLLDIARASESLGVTFRSATRLVGQLEALGILEEVTGQRRNRLYRYSAYIDLFTDERPPAFP